MRLIEEVYVNHVNNVGINSDWEKYTLEFASVKKVAGTKWRVTEDIPKLGWFLGGAHDIKVYGTFFARKCNDIYEFKDIDTKWQWHDELDAHDYAEMWKESNKDILITALEGTWDVLFDKAINADYYMIINWSDNRKTAKTVLPKRKGD